MAVTSTSQLPEITKHIHSAQKVYPTAAGPVAVTAGVGAWVLSAAFTQIVPASTITNNYCLTGCYLSDIEVDTYELVLYFGESDTECARIAFVPDTDGSGYFLPLSTIIIPANAKIRAKMMGAAGSTVCNVKLFYILHV